MRTARWLVVLVILLCASSVLARTWTDIYGNTTSAKFIRVHEGNVVLKRGNKIITIPFDELSAEDKEYVRKKLGDKGKELLPPPDEPGDDFGSVGLVEGMLPQPDDQRTWTDTKGRQIEAKLVGVKGNDVILHHKGRDVNVPIYRLSPEDRRYVRERMARYEREKNQPEATPPKTSPASPASPPPAPRRQPSQTPRRQPPPRIVQPPRVKPINPNPFPGNLPQHQLPSFPQHNPIPAERFLKDRGIDTNTPSARENPFAWKNLTADKIASLVIGFIIGSLIGTVIGAVVLRLACSIYNALTGGRRSANAVPTPNFGTAAGIAFSLILIGNVTGFISRLLGGLGPAVAVLAGLVSLIIYFLASVSLISSALPTSTFRAGMITIINFAIYLVIGIAIIACFMGSFGAF